LLDRLIDQTIGPDADMHSDLRAMTDNGGFVWANREQMAKWGKADRPEGGRWTGTVHRQGCRMLGMRGGTIVRLTHDQLHPAPPAAPPQTCMKCGGDGKPFIR
jgi:hypothetical protein